MAQKIEEFEFSSNRYQWDEWLDGGIWVLKQGEDFDVEMTSMRSLIFAAAGRRGLKSRTHIDAKNKTITIQSYKEGGE
jgi:hypothetical protein